MQSQRNFIFLIIAVFIVIVGGLIGGMMYVSNQSIKNAQEKARLSQEFVNQKMQETLRLQQETETPQVSAKKEYVKKYDGKNIFSFTYPASFTQTNDGFIDKERTCYFGAINGIGFEGESPSEKRIANMPVKIATYSYSPSLVSVSVAPFIKEGENKTDYIRSWAEEMLNLVHANSALVPSNNAELDAGSSALVPDKSCVKDFEETAASLKFYVQDVVVK